MPDAETDAPPDPLVLLAEAVAVRLHAADVKHEIVFVPPKRACWWRLVVWLEDGVVDDLFAAPGASHIAIVPNDQEQVPVELAADYVAMCADVLPEDEWWRRFREVREIERQERRAARRARWQSRLHAKR